MSRKINTRTILIATFLSVAMITPVFAGISYNAVQDTSQESQKIIETAMEITEITGEGVEQSQSIVYNLENIRDHQENSDQSQAREEADKLSENFEDFVSTTNKLISYMEESEEDFEKEKEAIRDSQEEIQFLIQYTVSTVDQGAPIGSFAIEDSQEEINRVSEVSTQTSRAVMQKESSELLELNEGLENLSTTILIAGILTVLLGITVGLLLSILISRPINQLNKEAKKIQREEFDDVKLEKVETRIKEFDDFREVMEDVVIALKSEFQREREGMNDLALDLVEILSKSVPRGVAESSLTSAADKADVSPLEMTEEDAEKVIKNLEVSTRGLGVDKSTFEEMREKISQ